MGCMGCGDLMKPVLLRLARDDLKEIHGRLIEFGGIPPKKFKDAFMTFCTNVTSMPLMYPKYDFNQKYHKAVIKYDYIVFYQVEKIKNTERAKIYRVLHGKQDILPLLDD